MATEPSRKTEEHHVTTKKETNQSVKNPVITSAVRNILLILSGLVIVGAAGFLIFRNRPSNDSRTPNTADEIRQSFNPPTSISPSFTPPTPGSGLSGGPGSATSTPSASPRAQAPPQPAAPNQPAPTAPTVYRNTNLGFEFSMPGDWVADDAQNPNRVVFFDRTTGRIAGYVEVYSDVGGNDLASLTKMLDGSPSVSKTSPTNVAGQPATAYSARSVYTDNIAVIFQNRVYYLHGHLTARNVIQSFKFIS